MCRQLAGAVGVVYIAIDAVDITGQQQAHVEHAQKSAWYVESDTGSLLQQRAFNNEEVTAVCLA